jgi:hypothetical protein
MKMTMDGEEIDADELGKFDFQIEHRERTSVIDVFETTAEGLPRRLRRTFEGLGGKESTHVSSDEFENNDDSEYESELEGKSVVFSWDEESGAFDVAYADGQGDEDLLAKLEEDMDLRAFLPGKAVDEGDSWEIDVKAFQSVLDPGGDLALVQSDGEDEDTSAEDQELRDNLTGSLEATYRGTREEEGRRLAVIALAVDARTHTEEELGEEQLDEGESGVQRTEVTFELTGELLWDCEHGHAWSLELGGTNGAVMQQTLQGVAEGESYEQTQTMSFTGEARFTMRFERK